jgi:pilus assembly protein Flp/PilA
LAESSIKQKREEIIMSKIKAFFRDESGQAMTEYGLIIALVAIAVIGALGAIGTALSGKFNTISNNITNGN